MMNAGRVRQWCFLKKKHILVVVIALSSALVLTLLRGNLCDRTQEVLRDTGGSITCGSRQIVPANKIAVLRLARSLLRDFSVEEYQPPIKT